MKETESNTVLLAVHEDELPHPSVECGDERTSPVVSGGSPAPSPAGSEIWAPSVNGPAVMQVDMLLKKGCKPTDIISLLFPHVRAPMAGWNQSIAISILSELLDEPPKRTKLVQYNSLDDAVQLFRESRRILILTGAGVSVSCGIPDFRSKDGIYARLHTSYPDLPDPSAMFDLEYFKRNPKPFYDFAQEIFPGLYQPSFSHRFIGELEKRDQLLRNYTQNIDTLERVAGITRLVECHGSFSNATCLTCKAKYTCEDVRPTVLKKEVAMCRECATGVIKPDIVFFGEDLHESFHLQMAEDKDHVDLLVVIGSSLKVRPVSLIPFSVSPSVPQILINREPLSSYSPDIQLLGNCDDILHEIAIRLGFEQGTTTKREIPAEEFREIFDRLANADEKDEEKETEKDDVPDLVEEDHLPPKRPRLEDLYQRRYVSIEEQLPPDSFFRVSSNVSVFPGAELFVDLDTGIVCQPPRIRTSQPQIPESSFDSDEVADTSSDCDSESSHPLSEPPFCHSPEPLPIRVRSASCHDPIDVDTVLPASLAKDSLGPLLAVFPDDPPESPSS